MNNSKIKLQLEPVSIKEANQFILNYHRHNKPVTGGKAALAATYSDLGIVGVVIISRPIARLADDGYTLEVTRSCVAPNAPKNTNSFLYSRAWRLSQALGYHRLITYTLQSESGSSLKAIGFKVVGQINASELGKSGWIYRPNREWQDVYSQPKFKWELFDSETYEPNKVKVQVEETEDLENQESLFSLLE